MSLLSPQLEAFLAVVACHTVHAAAEQINLTQTAVTQRIRTLEAKLRTTLFIRTRRGMQLTPEGEALLRYCRAAQDLEGSAMATIHGGASETIARVCITGPTSIMRSRIIPQCAQVMKQFPKLMMHFDVTDRDIREQSLRSGKSQFAILSPESLTSEMEYKKLAPEEYVLVCSARWKNRDLKDIIQTESIIDYNPEDRMTFNYLKKNRLLKLTKKERHFVNRTESLALLLAEGLGYSLLTTEFAKPYVDKKQLIILNEGKSYNHSPVLAWYKRPEPPAYFSGLIDTIM